MFRTLALTSLAAAYVAVSAQAAVLAQYTFGTVDTPTFAATTTDPLLTASAVTGNAALTAFNLQTNLGYASQPVLLNIPSSGSTTAANAVTNASYFSFTVDPTSVGATFSLTNLTFDAARGGSGSPRGWVVRSSADSFATNLGTSDIGTVRSTFTNYSVSLTGSSFQDLTGPITFRIYSYSPSTLSSVEYDNITLNGVAIPEPSSLALLAAGGLLIAKRRRRNA